MSIQQGATINLTSKPQPTAEQGLPPQRKSSVNQPGQLHQVLNSVKGQASPENFCVTFQHVIGNFNNTQEQQELQNVEY